MADAPIGSVSLARCAELLTAAADPIDRSALSRYCDRYDLKRGRAGREVLVNFEEVRAHRAQNYTRQVMSGGHEIPQQVASAEAAETGAEAAASAVPAPVNGPAASSAIVTPIPDRTDPQRELKQLQLRRELRDEALEEGRLTDTAEVDAGVADAILAMRAAFAEARADMAEDLAAKLALPPEKVRALRAGLRAYDRIGQDRFAASMAKLLQDGNEAAGDAEARLARLVAYAMRLRAAINPAFADAAEVA